MAKREKIRSLEDALISSVEKAQNALTYCARCGAPVETFTTTRDVVTVGPMVFHQACYQTWVAEQQAKAAARARQQSQSSEQEPQA